MPEAPDPLSARYFALLYSPPSKRIVLEHLLGIEREVSDSLRPGLDHHVAHSRLQWWADECQRTVEGRPVHPLTRGLLEATGGSSPEGLPGIVDVTVWDLAGATFETRRELTAYCQRWAAAMVHPLGAPLALGAALREIELLSDLAREAHRGRIRLPLEELERISTDPGGLARPPWPGAVAELLRSRHNSLRAELAHATSTVDRERQPELRGILVWAALAARSLDRNERTLPDRREPGRFDAMADTWLAWRTARQATLGQFDGNRRLGLGVMSR